MTDPVAAPLIENNLRTVRVAAGFGTVADLAERAGIDPAWCARIEDGEVLATRDELERLMAALGVAADRIYERTWRQLTMIDGSPFGEAGIAAMARQWRIWRDESHMLMSRDEQNYYEQPPGLDHEAEVYVNMSCGTMRSPHLLQDTVSVFEALGISFVAAAGPSAGCCGKPLAMAGAEDSYERHRRGRVERSQAWGATTHVNWCGACQQIATAMAARDELTEGPVHPVREIQVLPFLAERVRALGDKVPWKKEVRRRVLAEGHPGSSNVHAQMQAAIAELVSMVPGATAVGLYDGWSELSPCAAFGLEGSPAPAWTARAETAEELDEHRARLAAQIHARGADTVACHHQTCHQLWSRYASDELAVMHPVSVLAEALDCRHPDRFQDAVRDGNAQRLIQESRPRWQSWGMSEERAHEIAESILDVSVSRKNVINGAEDAESYAMQRRIAAGYGCAGGCGGCHSHTAPELLTIS